MEYISAWIAFPYTNGGKLIFIIGTFVAFQTSLSIVVSAFPVSVTNHQTFPCVESLGSKLYKTDNGIRTNWSPSNINRSSASKITSNMATNPGEDTDTSRTFAPVTEDTNSAIKEDTQFSEADLLEQMTEFKNLLEKTTTPSQTIPSPQTTNQTDQNGARTKEVFDWYDHWYPVHVVDTMDPTRPHKVQLLGLDLVLWNDGITLPSGKKEPGDWNTFEDSCPHRRAPLSEGRVEDDGSLLCSYHGWRYDGEGSCSSLPFSPSKFEKQHRAKASCETFPTKVLDGMVWVFPRSGYPGLFRSEERPPPLVSELHELDPAYEIPGEQWQMRIPAGVRDFPCGFDTMIENTLDPAHFCAAHHGTLGDRYTDPTAFDFKVTRSLTTQEGFALDGDMGSLEFIPPCLVKYRPNYRAMPFNDNLILATYCVPTAPGKVRPLATVLRRKGSPWGTTLSERALAVFMGPIQTPAWFGHVASSVVLHQDAGLLYNQYRNLRSKGYEPSSLGKDCSCSTKSYGPPQTTATGDSKSCACNTSKTYQDLCYTPNRVDKGIVTFRQWIETRARGGVPWSCEDVLPVRGTEDIFDMKHAHTENCQYCTDAYRNLEAIKQVCCAAFVGLLLAPPDFPHRIPLALLVGGMGMGLEKFNQLFVRYEFNHADNE